MSDCSGKMDIRSNRRIAKNTAMLYIRQILILAVGLYTSRLVLNALGTTDYGIYQVVGGFVMLFNIVSGAFSVAITRFMSHEYVSRNPNDVSRCFSTAMVIQGGLGIIICLLIATLGVWYVKHVMVLPEGRIEDAMIVMAFSAIAFFAGLINIPFNALIVANERMQAFAYIGLAEAVIRLLVALAILKVAHARLIVYGALTLLSSLIILMLYILYCKKHFKECRFVKTVDKGMLKSMSGFISWAFLGNGSVVVKDQGVNMVLNYFGGTTVNAARGIANSVNGSVVSFTQNYIRAIQPQITKLYSAGQRNDMCDLIFMSTKYSFFLMLMFCLPILKNLEYILFLWLGQLPDYTVGFLTMTLLASLVSSLSEPMLYGILATAKIKTYEILLTITYVSSLPLCYLVLKLGGPMISAYYIVLILTIFVQILVTVMSKKTYGLSLTDFAKRVIVRVGAVAVPAALTVYLVRIPVESHFLELLLETLFSIIVTGGCVWLFGLGKGERLALSSFVRQKFIHRTA